MAGGDSMGPGLQLVGARISFYESYYDSSNFADVDTLGNSNGHISVLRDATVTWLGTLVVLHVLCTLM